MSRRPFLEACAMGQKLLDWYRAKCRANNMDPHAIKTFDAAWDTFSAKMDDWDPVAASAVWMFAAAALGFRREHRPHLLAWKDARGGVRYHRWPWPDTYETPPALEHQLRTCSADLRREHSAA